MASSRPVRKRHSTVFYRDEPAEKPPPRRSLPVKPPPEGDVPSNIPEVLIAPDGRKFYPCRYCCKAFAFKKGQVSHIKACPHRVVEVSADDAGKAKFSSLKVEVSVPVLFADYVVALLSFQLNESENLLTPIKFEAVSSCPDYTSRNSKQNIKNVVKQPIKRKTSEFPTYPTKRIKCELDDTLVMPVLKCEVTNRKMKPHPSLNNSVCERVKKLDSVSLIPIKKSPATSETIDIHKPTSCKPCRRVFPNAVEYLRHKREMHLGTNSKLSPETLKVYDKIFMESDKTTCPICMKPTKLMTWRRHLSTHSTQSNYVCEICKKGFNRIDHLKNHKKRHLMEMEEV